MRLAKEIYGGGKLHNRNIDRIEEMFSRQGLAKGSNDCFSTGNIKTTTTETMASLSQKLDILTAAATRQYKIISRPTDATWKDENDNYVIFILFIK